MKRLKIALILGTLVILSGTALYKYMQKDFVLNKIEVVQANAQKVLGLRRKGKYVEIGEMAFALVGYLQGKRGLHFAGAPIFVFHETMEQSAEANENGTADLEMCVPIFGNTRVEKPFKIYELPGGTMVKIIHKGPYLECTKAYDRLFAWVERNGYRITGSMREVYLNDPRNIKPEDILTEIQIPIEQKA